ncbi:MAG TPA: CoA transferase, partial [Mycobacterium sp.]|nr:CoA transferase [Mycobacterium sp.]
MTSLAVPTAVLARAQRVADAYETLTGVNVDVVELLGGRAMLLDRVPRGRMSAGGATCLMPARDGWCALTLSRQDDVDAIPALVGADRVDDTWAEVHRWVADNDTADVTERARLLGLPVAALTETPAEPPHVYPFGAAMRTR